jgi:uncharacterized protein YggE
MTVPATAQDQFSRPTMTIQGHGEVTASPDTAYVTSGVTTQGATAREALDANTAAMTELIATLTGAGIERRDIQTAGFSVQPNYVYTDLRDANGYSLPPRINGYTVSNNVTVRVRALETLGAILDQSVTVGANTIGGISFAVAESTHLYDEARKLAFSDALRKGRLYADAARVELEAIRAITEQSYGQPQPYMMRDKAMAMEAAAPVPVEAGELTFAIDVSVTWEIGD